MMRRGRIGTAAVAVALAVAGVPFLWAAPASAAGEITKVGGGAWGAEADITLPTGQRTGIQPTPNVTLPEEGNPDGYFGTYASESFVLGSIDTIAVVTRGGLDGEPYAHSKSWMGGVFSSALGLDFKVLESFCDWTKEGSSGGSLVVFNSGRGDTPLPNTTQVLPGIGTLTFNEQHTETLPSGATVLYVYGLHIHLDGTLGVGDIFLAISSCDPLKLPFFGSFVDTRRTANNSEPIFVFDMYHNPISFENCFDGVDNNGDGLTDAQDPQCDVSPPPCAENGLDALASTPLHGTLSERVHNRVEPIAGIVGLDGTVHDINCNVVVPVEQLVNSLP